MKPPISRAFGYISELLIYSKAGWIQDTAGSSTKPTFQKYGLVTLFENSNNDALSLEYTGSNLCNMRCKSPSFNMKQRMIQGIGRKSAWPYPERRRVDDEA